MRSRSVGFALLCATACGQSSGKGLNAATLAADPLRLKALRA